MNKTHLMVGGPARSGTRFLANALNRHDAATVQGELHTRVLDCLFDMLFQIDKVYKKPEYGWRDRRVETFDYLILQCQQYRQLDASGSAFTGFKLPYVEYKWRELLQVYGQMTFVFCLREFEPHWLSVTTRWPERRIQDYAKRYKDSIEAALQMMGHPRINLVAFSLDRMKARGTDHLVEVGRSCGLPEPERWAATIDLSSKANASESYAPKKRAELNEQETQYLKSDLDIRRLYNTFWETYDADAAAFA